MTSPTSSSPPDQPPGDERKAREATERFELLDHITRLFEQVMTVLGLVFLGLLLLDYAGGRLRIAGADRLDDTLTAIWVIFVVDFALRLFIAPAKRAFLRENWLTVLATATEYRQSAIAAFVAMDRAWREVVTDAVFTGGVGKSAAGEATGLTRFRIHQILGAKKADSTELVKIAEAIAQDRTSSDPTAAEDADGEAAVL